MDFPTLRARLWLLRVPPSIFPAAFLCIGPPMFLFGFFSIGTGISLPLGAQLDIFIPGPATLLALPAAVINLLVVLATRRPVAWFEWIVGFVLDRQLLLLVTAALHSASVEERDLQPHRRLEVLLAAIVFIPAVLFLALCSCVFVLASILVGLWVLASGSVPGPWKRFAPPVIRAMDAAANFVMTGRRPGYVIEFTLLKYPDETVTALPGTVLTDRSQLWRPRPRRPSA